jgi:hypothetical protein
MIDYYHRQPLPGLGALIIILSALADTRQSARVLHYTHQHSLQNVLDVLNISSITHCVDSSAPNDHDWTKRFGDLAKFFSPYIKPETVNIRGQQLATQIKPNNQKRYLAVCYSNNGNPPLDQLIDSAPHHRYYTVDTWGKIFQLAVASGYEVVTINRLDVSLEDKVDFLIRHCAAVITYEGGMAHLAHCLDIPVIMLPWRCDEAHDQYSKGNPVDEQLMMFLQALHLDEKTWFLADHHEILNYKPDDLHDLITRLRSGLGNNVFVQNPALINITTLNEDPRFQRIRFTPFELDFFTNFILSK